MIPAHVGESFFSLCLNRDFNVYYSTTNGMELIKFSRILVPLCGIPFADMITKYFRCSIWSLNPADGPTSETYIEYNASSTADSGQLSHYACQSWKNWSLFCQPSDPIHWHLIDNVIRIWFGKRKNRFGVIFGIPIAYTVYEIRIQTSDEPRIFEWLYFHKLIAFRLQLS